MTILAGGIEECMRSPSALFVAAAWRWLAVSDAVCYQYKAECMAKPSRSKKRRLTEMH